MALTKEQIKEFKEAEAEADAETDNFYNLKEVADNLAKTGDLEWARKVYKKAEGKAKTSDDFRFFGQSLFEKLNDKEWSLKQYKKAEDKAEYSEELYYIARALAEDFNDKKNATSIYKKAIEKTTDCQELGLYGWSIFKHLGDKEWADNVLNDAEKAANESSDFMYLAEQLCEMNNKEWSIRLYKKAEEQIGEEDYIGINKYMNLADELNDKLADKNWAKEIYEKALKCAQDNEEEDQIEEISEKVKDL
tara:strand:+ start:199 stop:945 length:747 start_codon:yes stop_codon:yes gene_type:complete